MAKELPYFKFFVSEWSDGDITLEEFDTQGLFVNLCAYYWSNNCEITLTKAKKRFRNCRPECFNELIESKIIKLEGDLIVINFLVDQLLEREAKSNQNSINGKKGGRPKKRTESEKKPTAFNSESETKAKQKPIREEKKREEKNIPALSEFLAYALEKKPNVDQEAVKLKYEAWQENDWVNGNGKQIKNWKSNLLNVLQYLAEKQKPKTKNTSSGLWQ